MRKCKRRKKFSHREHDHSHCNKKDEDKCRREIRLINDCLCCEWSVPPGDTQTIFVTGGFNQIFGSGFISYDDGDADFVTVTFFLNGTQVGAPINVFLNSCVTFTFTRFDQIRVSCPSMVNGSTDTDVCEGEICIKTRFPV